VTVHPFCCQHCRSTGLVCFYHDPNARRHPSEHPPRPKLMKPVFRMPPFCRRLSILLGQRSHSRIGLSTRGIRRPHHDHLDSESSCSAQPCPARNAWHSRSAGILPANQAALPSKALPECMAQSERGHLAGEGAWSTTRRPTHPARHSE